MAISVFLISLKIHRINPENVRNNRSTKMFTFPAIQFLSRCESSNWNFFPNIWLLFTLTVFITNNSLKTVEFSWYLFVGSYSLFIKEETRRHLEKVNVNYICYSFMMVAAKREEAVGQVDTKLHFCETMIWSFKKSTLNRPHVNTMM